MSEPRAQQTRPPVPALIPLAALRPAPPAVPEVAAAATASSPCVAVTAARAAEDEDGSTRTRRPNAARAIDAGAWSRDARAPSPRRTAQRHRKSDRRRRERALLHASAGDINDVDKNRHLRKQRRRRRSGGCATITTQSRVNKHRSSSSSSSSCHVGSPPAAPPPRVNPIFLWVRQEDTHIVEVRCEDYDKRNRIRLTKTPHGWRAIPRTETLAAAVTVPQQPSVVDSVPATESTVVKQRKNRKSSKSKRKASVEDVCSESRHKVDVEDEEQEESTTAIIQTREESSSPAWSAPVNIESHLPSHTIAVPRKKATAATSATVGGEEDDGGCSVNSVVECTAPPRDPGTVGGGGDATALDNLLAVAELEFNHQVQQEAELEQEAAKINEDNYSEPSVDEIGDTQIENITDQEESIPSSEIINERNYSDITEQHKEFFENIVQLNKLIESRSERVSEPSTPALPDQSASDLVNSDRQTEDCDYNDDDENNLAMDDIITRLEQSLQSPEACAEVDELCAEATSYIAFDDDARVRDATTDAVKGEEAEQNYDAPESQQHADDEESDVEIKAEVSCPQDLTEMDLSVDVPTSQNEGDDMLPTDLSITNNDSDDADKEASAIELEEPTDLSTNSKHENIIEDEYEDDECVESTEDDLLPTDLSIPKHLVQTPPRTETPRPASHGSETIQSPQPSGIPAVPPSPDILSSNSQKSKSIFLETLLSSTSPKLCLTPEVTITRQQKEPLDLGKSRKSASPTVTCSEEAKSITKTNTNSDGEPAAKRLKIEDITLKSLLHMERKNKPEVTISKSVRPVDKVESPNQKIESSRLLELLTNEADPDPVTQLKQILADPELNIPDPLLVPKDRLSQILSAPAREIPRLLALRPELRLPEALAFPQLLQDPDILVISLAQLQTILHKQNETLKLQETTRSQEKTSPKLASPTTKKAEEKAPTPSNYNTEAHPRYPSASALPGKEARGSVGALAGDIDAATTAAFNQMLWLPYLSQLEAAAVACGNNNEFMKALNSIFPPSFPPPDPTQMFGRFNTPPFPMHPPPPVDYTNQLEIALWQEAMLKANMNNFGGMQHQSPMHQRPKNSIDSIALKSAYRENNGLTSNKKQSANQRVHSSARTSPITHTFQQQKAANVSGGSSSSSIPPNPYLNSIPSAYQLPNTNLRSQSLQIPQYNPSLAQWSRTSTSSHSSRANSNSSRLSNSSVPNHHNHYSTNSKLDYFKHHQNMSAAAYGQQQRYNQHLASSQHLQQQPQQKPTVQHQQQQQQPKAPTSEQQTRPRVTCKSLQNLLSPSRLSQEMNAMKRSHEITTSMVASRVPPSPSATQPIDLSGVPKSASSKLKIKQHLADNARLPPKLFKHDEVPEVGSTTSSIDEMTSAQLTDAQTHLWHPLFGNLSSRTKIDSIHDRVRSVPVIASE